MNDPESTTRFERQPGTAAQLDRSHRQREVQRQILRVVPWLRRMDAHRREFVRRVTGKPHVVEFFHQVDDAYSQLALEAISPLLERYDIEMRFHLTSRADLSHEPEPDLLMAWPTRGETVQPSRRITESTFRPTPNDRHSPPSIDP